MSREPKTDPEISLLDNARALAANGHSSEARSMFRNVLQKTSPTDPAQASMRVSAMAGLIELAARNGQPQRTSESVSFLRDEIDFLSQRSLPEPVIDSIAAQLNTVCESLGALRRWKEIKQISRMVVRLAADERPESLAHRIRGLNNLGSALLAEARYDDAVHIWQCAIKDYSHKAEPLTLSPLATIHNNLGELRRLQYRLPSAVEHHAEAVRLRSECFPEGNVLVRQSLFNYAQVLAESKRYPAAVGPLEQLLDSLPSLDEADTPELLRATLLKCRVQLDTGKWESAESLVDQLVRVISRSQNAVPRFELEAHLLRLETALLLQKQNVVCSETDRLAELLQIHKASDTALEGRFQYLLAGMSTEASGEPVESREAHAQHALRIFRTRLPRNHAQTADAVFQLAQVFVVTQRGQRATQTANSAMAIYEHSFGETSIPMLHALIRVARVVLARNQFRNTRPLLKLALRLKREHNENVSPLVTFEIYDLLARMYAGLQKPKPAAYFARAAWQAAVNELEFPPVLETPLADRALELSRQAAHQNAALPVASRRIELLTASHHAGHPCVAEATEDLARLAEQAGDYDRAAETLSKVLPVRCHELGEDSDEAVELIEYAAELNRRAGRSEQAEELDQQAQQITQKASHVLSDLL